MGPEGFDPPPTGLKGRRAAATPRPRTGHLVPGHAFGPGHRLRPHYISVTELGRPDSNRRSQAPRACGLARLSHALIVPASSPCGNRTHLSALKGRSPRTDRRTGQLRVGRGALESPSAGLQPAATPSQLPALQEKARLSRDTGPGEPSRLRRPGVRGEAERRGSEFRRLTGETTRSGRAFEVTGPPG